MKTIIRLVITGIEVVGCMVAVQLAAFGYPTFGFLLASAMVLLAWTEGSKGWGSQISQHHQSGEPQP